MPVPRWVAQINKRVFNPREARRGDRPVLTHVGRHSGKSFKTPLDAHEVDGGYLFIPLYGSESDWVQNILASGRATLSIDGQDTELDVPRLITKETALAQLPPTTKLPPGLFRITEYLRMDVRP